MELSICFVDGLFNQPTGDFIHHIENSDLNCLMRKIHSSFSGPSYLFMVYLSISSIYAVNVSKSNVNYICLMESTRLKSDLTASFYNRTV